MTQQTGQEIAVREIPSELRKFKTLGEWLALSESKDDSAKVRAATGALRLYYAGELGLPPTGASDLSMIHGKLHIGAQTYRALAKRAGYRVAKESVSPESCTAVLYRGDEEVGRETITIEQARKAGWIRDGSAWQKTPERMLWARASSWVIRDFAPEVGLGVGVIDEIEDVILGEADFEEMPEPEPEEPREPEPDPEPEEAVA